MDTEKQRQHGRNDARLTERGNAYRSRVADQQRMAARRTLEWIGGPAGF